MSQKKNDHFQTTNTRTQCQDCQERQTGCHSHCKAYLAYAASREKVRKTRISEAEANNDYFAVFTNRHKSNARSRKGR